MSVQFILYYQHPLLLNMVKHKTPLINMSLTRSDAVFLLLHAVSAFSGSYLMTTAMMAAPRSVPPHERFVATKCRTLLRCLCPQVRGGGGAGLDPGVGSPRRGRAQLRLGLSLVSRDGTEK